MAVLQSGRRVAGYARPTPTDEEMGDITGVDAVDWDSLVEVREGDTSDLVIIT